MAHFIVTAQGQAGPTSRLGSKRSGITAHARGWDAGVRVVGSGDPTSDRDTFDIYATAGSGSSDEAYIGQVTRDTDGHLVFIPGPLTRLGHPAGVTIAPVLIA